MEQVDRAALIRNLINVGCCLVLQATYLQGAPPQAANPQAEASSSASQAASPQRSLLTKYCVTCHNERLRTAGVLLDKADIANVSVSPDMWEKVVHKIRSGEMPPAGLPRPDKATFDAFAAWLESGTNTAPSPEPY
jgi:mono/diheme cytochrome c family protein